MPQVKHCFRTASPAHLKHTTHTVGVVVLRGVSGERCFVAGVQLRSA